MLRLALRNLLAHKLRLLLSAAAVVMGVAFISGTMVFTDTLDKTFTDLFQNSTSDVEVQPKAAFETGLTGTSVGGSLPTIRASVVPQVNAVDGVKAAEGYVLGDGVYVLDRNGKVLSTGGAPGIGGSWSRDESLRMATLVEGQPPVGPHEILLDTGTIEKTGYDLGDRVTVLTPGPRVRATLVGIVRYGDSGGMAGATLTVFDVPTAQRLLLRPDRYTGISVTASGVSDEELAGRISAAIGPGYDVKTSAQNAEDLSTSMKDQLSFINTFLLVFAGVALFVGTFIILNTFSMIVAQRTRELALFRALGASRRQTTWSVLAEAFVLGLLGAATGLLLGYGLALALKAFFSSFGVTLDSELVFSTATVAWSLGVGVVVTMVAAYLPARRASRVPPVAAMNPDVVPVARSLRLRALVGAPLLLLGGLALVVGPSLFDGSAAGGVAGAGAAALVIGAIALSPVLARPFIQLVGWVMPRIAGKTGQLAQENALRNPRRTAATSSALMIGLALVTGFSVIGASAKESLDAVIADTMQADYVVSAAVGQPFTSAVATKISRLDGVDSVTRTRFAAAQLGDTQSAVVAYDAGTVDRSLDADFTQGSFEGMRGNGLLVDDVAATENGWHVGDQVAFLLPTGQHRTLTVGGIFKRNNVLGTYVISMRTFMSTGGTPLDRYVYINLSPGADASAVGGAIQKVISSYPVVELKDSAQFQKELRAQVDQLLTLINALLVLSVFIAFLGVVNTLVLSVIERTRELGLLRAIGMNRRQVRRLVRLESVVISVYGAVLGVALGLVLGVSLTSALGDNGITHIAVPAAQLTLFVVLGAVIGVVAAVFPARRAARLKVLEAIATQ